MSGKEQEISFYYLPGLNSEEFSSSAPSEVTLTSEDTLVKPETKSDFMKSW